MLYKIHNGVRKSGKVIKVIFADGMGTSPFRSWSYVLPSKTLRYQVLNFPGKRNTFFMSNAASNIGTKKS